MPSAEVPTYSRAAVLEKAGSKYEVVELATPQPGPGEVLVRMKASGICHSDLAAHTPESPEALQPIRPLIGGHEGVGLVVKLGEGVTRRKVGDLVGLAFLASNCGVCEACTSGSVNVCQAATFRGFTVHGTFAEYAIAEAEHAILIPASVAPDQACPILCAGLTVYKALKLAQPLAGQWVVVPGAGGGLGHLAVQYGKSLHSPISVYTRLTLIFLRTAKAMGLRVVGIDSTAKAELVKTCGAEHFVDFSAVKDVVSEVIRLTGGGAHLSIICVAHPSGYTDALLYARTLGKIACVGLAPFGLHSAQLIGKQLTLIGSQTGSQHEAAEALSFVERGLVRCELEKRSLHDVERTLDDLKKGRIGGRVVIEL
ncbi:hypothetical protein JCM1840_006229 [Sporobolomyces johnsonii]